MFQILPRISSWYPNAIPEMDAIHFMAIESSPISTWVIPQMGDPQHGWFTMEIPLKINWMIQGHLKGHLRKPPHMSTVRRSLQFQENPSGLCSARSRHLLGSYISGQRTMVDFWGFLSRSCWAQQPSTVLIHFGRYQYSHPPKKDSKNIRELYTYLYNFVHISLIGFITSKDDFGSSHPGVAWLFHTVYIRPVLDRDVSTGSPRDMETSKLPKLMITYWLRHLTNWWTFKLMII